MLGSCSVLARFCSDAMLSWAVGNVYEGTRQGVRWGFLSAYFCKRRQLNRKRRSHRVSVDDFGYIRRPKECFGSQHVRLGVFARLRPLAAGLRAAAPWLHRPSIARPPAALSGSAEGCRAARRSVRAAGGQQISLAAVPGSWGCCNRHNLQSELPNFESLNPVLTNLPVQTTT